MEEAQGEEVRMVKAKLQERHNPNPNPNPNWMVKAKLQEEKILFSFVKWDRHALRLKVPLDRG